MQIACTTLSAAGEVVTLLMDAHLWPGLDYKIVTTNELDPPVTFVITSDVPAETARQMQDIEDITIANERGA